MACSLIGSISKNSDRYAHTIEYWQKAAGHEDVGFDNAVFLSENDCAHKNRALAHLMMQNNAFPTHANIEDTLRFYFQTCSITVSWYVLFFLSFFCFFCFFYLFIFFLLLFFFL